MSTSPNQSTRIKGCISKWICFIFGLTLLFTSNTTLAYPIDGYPYTGIKRLLYQYRIFLDSTKTSRLDPGALLMMEDIELSLDSSAKFPDEDADLARRLRQIFSSLEPQYSMSLMDISDPSNIKYAGLRENIGYQPGSVGKIAIAIALFSELNRVYGDDWANIIGVLKSKHSRAGVWAISDHHTVPFYDIEKDNYYSRVVRESDVFSLYEWVDHMFSKSNNAAASIVWREAMLIHIFGKQYECLSQQEADEYFEITPKKILTDIAMDIVKCPIEKMGITEDEWRLGSFFTGGADRKVPGKGGSIGTTRGLMKFLFQLEKGNCINPRSSLEIKRLMYMTDRRIRYASARVLDNDAVYFKSGSLYSFKEEPGFVRRNYAGNRYNYMNSVAIVEKLDGSGKKYIVVLMSNVLRKNSVAEHYGLATTVDRLIMGG